MSIYERGNKCLTVWGFKDPIHYYPNIMLGGEKMKEATSGEVIKLEKEGDSIEGIYNGYEESKQFKGSYAVKISVDGKPNVVFVSGIVVDLIETNSIKIGMKIKIQYTGKQKSSKSGMDYNTYKVFYE